MIPTVLRPVPFHRKRSTETMIRLTVGSSFGYMPPESRATLRRNVAITLFVAAAAASCLVLYKAADSFQFLPSYSDHSSFFRHVLPAEFSDSFPDSDDLRLERVLNDAAMEDRTVILTTLNEAWAAPNSVIDLFLDSFRTGDGTRRLMNHLVIIALDRKAFSRCLLVHIHCFPLISKGVDFSREAYFMTPDYLKMMWRRIEFLTSVLEKGYNFIFTDADIMWFRDPFPRFYFEAEFQIACDHFSGSPDDIQQNRPNGGFTYVKSNIRTVEFYKFWYKSREIYPGYHDQDVLNIIKDDPFITTIGLKIRFLNTAYFGGLCEPSKDLNEVCTMHANCCYGLESKLHDLRLMLQDWKQFMSLPTSMKRSSTVSWRVPQNCSLDSLRHSELLIKNFEQ